MDVMYNNRLKKKIRLRETPAMAFQSNKSYYSIGEVSRISGVPAYLLRYWEGFFTELSPGRDTRGNRRYTNKDVALVLTIKELVYEKGYKIGKAKQMVGKHPRGVDIDSDDKTAEIIKLQQQLKRDRKNHDLVQKRRQAVLRDIKGEIEEVLQLLGS
ncbi:hypothetical protein Ptc2401_00612 [Prosthecochloris sp. CIB 2401]|nr:hypothetical protein Ptc2401_00612 [Prosthecochloris sp. CIB 2401]